MNEKKLSISHKEITINRLINNIKTERIYRNENRIVASLEVVDPIIKFYSMIFNWNFDKIESFYKESKIKFILKASSVDQSCEVSWLDPFFKYYNDKREELDRNLSSKDKLYLLQNEIYNEIEKTICSYSDNYFRNTKILETRMVQACIQSWEGKLKESDIVRGTGIECQAVRSIIELLKNDGIIQEQENGRLNCIKRKFSNDAVRSWQAD